MTGVSNLADMAFWDEEHFAATRLPARPDHEFPFDRCLARVLTKQAAVQSGARVLEVGCTPGRWLAFYAERFGAQVEGVEYSKKGVEMTRRNMELTGIHAKIHHADFFEFEPSPFDLVLSLGFIEHFDDLDIAFARHLDFVGNGGQLVIGVPNFCGLNRILQEHADPAYLRLHNLNAMRPELYRRFAQSHGLALGYLGYLGGFDPVLIKNERKSVGAIIRLETMYRRLPLADFANHRLLSSYLLSVFHRP